MATITKSIGTDSRDYETITLWEADLGSTSGGSGNDAVGECYPDSNFDEPLDINDATPDSIVLKPADAYYHDGTAGTGVTIIGSSDNYQFDADCGYLRVEGLEFDMNGTSKYASKQIVLNTGPIYFNRCIVHDMLAGNGGYSAIEMNSNNYVSNCIFYDFNVTGSSASMFIFNLDYAPGDNNWVYNCVGDRANCTTGSAAGVMGRWTTTSRKVINTAITNITGNTHLCFDPETNWVLTNCLDDDSTLPDSDGNLLGKDAADQYVSNANGSEDYHLKAGADAIDTGTDLGTTPTGVNIDIDGRNRDSEGDTWDIGADEYVSAGPAAAQPPSRSLNLLGIGI